MRIETMTRPVRTRRAGWRSRALASSLSALLVWTSAVPGIAAAQQAGVPLAVVHDPVTSGVAGEPLRIEARVASSGSRPFVVLHHRERGEGAYQDAVMPRVGIDGYLRELPTEAGVETTIEYWIEASADGATARAGSADEPIVADVAPAAATPPAPVADTRAPTVVDRPVAAATAGEAQRFEVVVTDDAAVEEVVLFHRAPGEPEFERSPMRASGGDRYVATVPTDGDATLIEYFVEARDASGNRESLGSRFMPRERPLDAASSVASAPAAAEEPAAKPRSRTLWYVLGGALLVGAAAAAAGGGGGGGGSGTTEPPPGGCCTVTIEVDAPQ